MVKYNQILERKILYDMMIIYLGDSKDFYDINVPADRLKLFSTIKAGLLKYLGLTSENIDVFLKEATIENANKAEHISTKVFLNDLTIHKTFSCKNLNKDKLNTRFVQASIKRKIHEKIITLKKMLREIKKL